MEVNSDEELADVEDRKPQQKSHLKEPPKPKEKNALFDDDDDEVPKRRKPEEKKQAERDDSPKSFLFKNSIDQAVKKPAGETQKEKPKQKFRDEDDEDEGPFEAKPKKKEPAPKTVESDYQDPLEKRLAAISQREAEAKKQQQNPVVVAKPEPVKEQEKESPVEMPSKITTEKEIEKIPKVQDDDDKPLDIEELKKKSTFVPMTFQRKGGDSDDEELSGWNS